jgi:hypothetical protein
LNNWQVPDFTFDEERRPTQEPDPFAQLAFAFGLGENTDDIGEACKADAAVGVYGFDPECCGEMTLPSAERPQKWMTSSRSIKSSWASARIRFPVERRLEGEVLTVESLAILSAILNATVLAQSQFLGEQSVDHIERAGFATLELTDRLIKNLECAGHLQTDQGLANGRSPRERFPGSSWPPSLICQTVAHGLVEVERLGRVLVLLGRIARSSSALADAALNSLENVDDDRAVTIAGGFSVSACQSGAPGIS